MQTLSSADARLATAAGTGAVAPRLILTLVSLLAVLGVASIWPTADLLWALWTTDALKSIGMFIPVVSFALILRAWHALDWELDGSWSGLVVLVLTSLAVLLRTQAVLVFVVSPQWAIYLPPHSLVAVAYATGVVLLFGGTRLLRASLFPLALLWFVNPVPHVFNVLVDLPLQRASAHVARGFAHLLGQPLSPDQMRLMFTPDFGMFIAPGCNGIRGSITMGFIALIAGYLNRFRWYATAAIVAAAILLGYVFNFVRLCTLVVYYIIALHFTGLQQHGEMADYIIGACLFLFATVLLTLTIRHFGDRNPAPARTQTAPARAPRDLPLRLAAMGLLVLFGILRFTPIAAARTAATPDSTVMGQFPQHLGQYTLTRTWNESLNTGLLLFHWAEYTPADAGPHISLGVAPVIGSHDTLVCHSARGEDPLWHGQLLTPTPTDPATAFSAAFFNDGATQFLELTTLCTGATCGEYAANRTHLGFVYSRPHPESIFAQNPDRPIPILLRAETLDTSTPPDFARQQLTADIQTFLASLNLPNLTEPYRRK